MKQYPKVFIVILNYNGRETLKKCLLSIFKNDYPNFEIVLVDNNSTDGSFEIAKTNFSKAHLIKNKENFGFAAGNNVGIRFALERMADFVLLLSNDAEAEKDFLSRLISAAEKNNKAGIFSPLIFSMDSRQIQFSKGKISWFRTKAFREKKIKTEDGWETDFATGSAMLIKKEVFKKAGLLDEDYFLFWADIDFSLRALRAGFENMVVASSWIYRQKKSKISQESDVYWEAISRRVFFKKNTRIFLAPWVKIYLALEGIKNFMESLNSKNEVATIIKKARRDFNIAKF